MLGKIGTWHMEYVPEGIDYSAMRGPCPIGFHVPLISEWQGLKTIMDGLSLTTGDNWKEKLHMPFAGSRSGTSASAGLQGSNGYYWSSSPFSASSTTNSVRHLSLNSSNVSTGDFNYSTLGISVRCFKDEFVVPTSSWTVVQGTLGSAGIFRDQTNGLISITSDGSTGYTIMDKNLGATTVYNSGDTLSEANCGKYFQRGNNYGFDWTGTLTDISTTQVDASTYGPGNYYSSSTFIKYAGRWDSSNNNNLWGGETGAVTIPAHYRRRTSPAI